MVDLIGTIHPHITYTDNSQFSLIIAEYVLFKPILLGSKLYSKVLRFINLITTNQFTKLQKASLGFPSESNNKGHVGCTVGNERSQLLLSVTFQVITAVTVPGYLA